MWFQKPLFLRNQPIMGYERNYEKGNRILFWDSKCRSIKGPQGAAEVQRNSSMYEVQPSQEWTRKFGVRPQDRPVPKSCACFEIACWWEVSFLVATNRGWNYCTFQSYMSTFCQTNVPWLVFNSSYECSTSVISSCEYIYASKTFRTSQNVNKKMITWKMLNFNENSLNKAHGS